MDNKKPLVLAIYASPRKGGNSEIALDKMLEGVATHDVEIDKLYPSKMRISPCIECNGCRESGHCVVDDDMSIVYPKLDAADYIILSAPIFFCALPAWTKALIDRTQANWVEKYLLKKPERKKPARPGFYILVGAHKSAKNFQGAAHTIKHFFDAIDFRIEGKLEFAGPDAKAEILDYPEYLEQAYRAGIDFISEGQVK
jgi:multimeric flavodoxin WrbA